MKTVGIALLSIMAGICVGFLISDIGSAPAPPAVQEPDLQARYDALLKPGQPGFQAHLDDGCRGDPSWSPCALELYRLGR